jgi:hypothetical protein
LNKNTKIIFLLIKKMQFQIGINNVKKENKRNIQNAIKRIKNPQLDYTQKLLIVLKEERSEEVKIKKKPIYNIDINMLVEERNNLIKEKIGEIKDNNMTELDKKHQVLSDQTESSTYIEKDEKEKKYSELKSSINLSKGESELGIYELHDDGSEISKVKKQLLKEKETTTINIKEEEEKIPILSIIQERENYIKERMSEITDENMNEEEKRIKVLKDEKSSRVKQSKNININFNINSSNVSEDSYSEYENNKTTDTTNNSIDTTVDCLNKSFSFFQSLLKEDKEKEKANKFNSQRAKFYTEHNLYDILLNIENKNITLPERYIINEKYFGLVYPNNLKTYYITESGFIFDYCKSKMKMEGIRKYKEECDKKVGIYFCGKKININNEIKICTKNNFICKECMKINKKMYNIKNTYLININGRVAKINKNKYHCFGRFIKSNSIEDCITNFSCEACKLLDHISHYYHYDV